MLCDDVEEKKVKGEREGRFLGERREISDNTFRRSFKKRANSPREPTMIIA